MGGPATLQPSSHQPLGPGVGLLPTSVLQGLSSWFPPKHTGSFWFSQLSTSWYLVQE